jgi:hypothetical protein
MDIYQYVTANNPYFTRSLINKYGYGFNRGGNLSLALQQLVKNEGQPVLESIIENHPDRDLFEDYFASKHNIGSESEKKLGCNGGCSGCAAKREPAPAYVGFTGVPQAIEESKSITSSTSVIILAAAMLITVGIIMK